MLSMARKLATGPTRVMVVDASTVVRGLITRILESEPGIEVVASVAHGRAALSALPSHHIDVVILDIEVPVMDGLTPLTELLKHDPGLKIIMTSALTLHNAEASLQAMQAGAADYITKPTASREIGDASEFRRDLIAKVRSLAAPRGTAAPAVAPSAIPGAAVRRPALHTHPPAATARRPVLLRRPGPKAAEVIAVASSTGGPQALFAFLCGIKPDIGLPILITQHMPPTFTMILAQHISRISGWRAEEARNGETIAGGRVYVAPGNYHMVVQQNGPARTIRLNQGPKENFCRPAADPMLRSIAHAYGGHVLAVILTGMGHDGLAGSNVVVAAGGTLIAQDEPSSVVWGMPGAVAMAGLCSAVLPLDELPPHVHTHLRRGAR